MAADFGQATIVICVLLLVAHILGHLASISGFPKLIGEILAGVLLGPFLFGRYISTFQAPGIAEVLNFIYWIGLVLLMFISGSESRSLGAKENRKEILWLVLVGTSVPFLAVFCFGQFLPLNTITGTQQHQTAALLVLSVAVAVTSIPVLSRIFYDLGILNTRFASLILGSAVLEDIILWIAVAVASSMVGVGHGSILYHVLTTIVFVGISLTYMPHFLRKDSIRHPLVKYNEIGYIFYVLFAYLALAYTAEVNLVFAAFLAGFGIIGGLGGPLRDKYHDSLDAIARVGFGLFIPLYFAIVGYKLVFGRDFSAVMLVIFLVGSSLVKIVSIWIAAKCARFDWYESMNLAITANARGGPGIVLASVAYDAGIINAPFYTTLVLTALITSQVSGSWLRFVLKKKWPLLR